MASVTSLPELVTGISSSAVFDLPDIAAGDVLGSCMFNVLILAVLDFLSGAAPISAKAHQGQVLTASFGILSACARQSEHLWCRANPINRLGGSLQRDIRSNLLRRHEGDFLV
jgi:Ca2+/Na+ antiporter